MKKSTKESAIECEYRLVIVGARYTRPYEISYLNEVKEAIALGQCSHLIELHDVTDDVDQFYKEADCLLVTSLNEVTPMVCEHYYLSYVFIF